MKKKIINQEKNIKKTLKLLLLLQQDQQNNVLKTIIFIHNNVINLIQERIYLSEKMLKRLNEAYAIFYSKLKEKWQYSLFPSPGIFKNRLKWVYEGLASRIDYFRYILVKEEYQDKGSSEIFVNFVWYSNEEEWLKSYNIFKYYSTEYETFEVTFMFFSFINTLQLMEKEKEKHNANPHYTILVAANDINEKMFSIYEYTTYMPHDNGDMIYHLPIKQKDIKTYIKYFNNETKKQKEIMKKYKKNEMITPEEYGIMGYNEEIYKKYREEKKEKEEREKGEK